MPQKSNLVKNHFLFCNKKHNGEAGKAIPLRFYQVNAMSVNALTDKNAARSIGSDFRASVDDFGRCLIFKLLEVLDEAGSQRAVSFHVLFPIRPGTGGVEDAIGHIRACHGNFETKDGIGDVFNLVEFASQDSVEDGTRVLDADALARAVRPAHPAGVD